MLENDNFELSQETQEEEKDNFPPLEDVLAMMLIDIAKELDVSPLRLIGADTPDRRLLRGACPICKGRLEPIYQFPGFVNCPRCHKWFDRPDISKQNR